MSTPEYTPYKDALTNAMSIIANKSKSIFIGQQILYSGNPMSTTLSAVPKEKMIEVPVMEESQMGMSLGLSMANNLVVTFYPRWDFLISATNQLVNHIDKIVGMSEGKWNPHLIIRLGKGSDKPLDPGYQHKGNYLEEFKSLCPNIKFYDLKTPNDIKISYDYSIKNIGIHCLVEYPELYYL
jgi:pyruvate/2-oxoglutarate/acetoin dehydrogenase E1 component